MDVVSPPARNTARSRRFRSFAGWSFGVGGFFVALSVVGLVLPLPAGDSSAGTVWIFALLAGPFAVVIALNALLWSQYFGRSGRKTSARERGAWILLLLLLIVASPIAVTVLLLVEFTVGSSTSSSGA